MKPEEFKQFAYEIINFIVDYKENIRSRPVLPSVTPGYLAELIPCDAPDKPEQWTNIMSDFENYIMPGMTHWLSPLFNAYFPTGGSYPSVLGELLSAGLGAFSFNWTTGPAITELEVLMLDWLVKMMGLPKHFLANSPGHGGGIIQASGSDIILITLLAAKERAVKNIKKHLPHLDEGIIRVRLVAYSSDQSHSCIEKAGILGSVITRLLPSDFKGRLEPGSLEAAIEHDKSNGLIPFYVVATLGTTGTCSFDPIDEIGFVCQKYNVWLHIDASYAGAAFICPEFRDFLKGAEHADSFNTNPYKWLLVNFDCSALWLKDCRQLTEAFTVERDYLKPNKEIERKLAPSFRNWEIPLGRRFRALKLWFTIRLYGVEGIQKYIRRHCELAKRFESNVRSDDRFEVVFPATMGLVCFRLRGKNELTKKLQQRVTYQKKLYLIGTAHKGKYLLRYVVNSIDAEEADIDQAWMILKSNVEHILNNTH